VRKQRQKKPVAPSKASQQFAPPVVPQAPLVALPPRLTRLIDRNELMRIIPVTYPTIWKWMREDKFPRSKNCGGKIVWLESDIEDWIKSRPAQPLKGDLESVAS
jgi:predicted DNA-binding transcriptional regulator AlpA